MKKLALMLSILTLFTFTSLFAQQSEAEKLYLKAMTTKNVEQRAQLLKQYIEKYGGQGTKYEKFAYANLCLLPYEGKTSQEAIQYGEKALSLGGLDDLTICQVYLKMADIFIQEERNLDKAINYAQEVIQIAKTNQNKESSATSPEHWKKLEGAAYFSEGEAQKKAENKSQALDSYIESYNILKSKEIINKIKSLGKDFYDQKSYVQAEKAFRISYQAEGDFASCIYLARSLYRDKKVDESLKYFKEAYSKQKSGELAYNIGIILANKSESDPSHADQAVKYLLEAAFLSKTHSEKAMSLAETLFFNTHKELQYNKTVKELNEKSNKLEELSSEFNKKFSDKSEEDLTEEQKKEMQSLLDQIESLKKSIKELEAKQKEALEKWQNLIEETKKRLGIS